MRRRLAERLAGARLLLTGATGFLGANLARRFLDEGVEVHALARPGSRRWRLADLEERLVWHTADLLDFPTVRALVAGLSLDFVVHAAAPHGHPSTSEERLAHLGQHVLGTAHLYEAIGERPACVVLHVGSSTEYGAHDVPLSESMALRPSSYRGAGKAAAAMLAIELSRRQPVTLVRPFSIYGPWEAPERFLPTICRRARLDQPLRLTRAGVQHDFVYVDDVVEACCRLLVDDRQRGRIFNLGSGVQTSNEAAAALVVSLTGSHSSIELDAHPAHAPDTAHWVADLTATEQHLGWRPTVTLADGLQRFLRWSAEQGATHGY